jgi:hypothetical protein
MSAFLGERASETRLPVFQHAGTLTPAGPAFAGAPSRRQGKRRPSGMIFGRQALRRAGPEPSMVQGRHDTRFNRA